MLYLVHDQQEYLAVYKVQYLGLEHSCSPLDFTCSPLKGHRSIVTPYNIEQKALGIYRLIGCSWYGVVFLRDC